MNRPRREFASIGVLGAAQGSPEANIRRADEEPWLGYVADDGRVRRLLEEDGRLSGELRARLAEIEETL
jgi:hypothetical protein